MASNITPFLWLKSVGVSHSYLGQKVEPGVIKDGRWDAGVRVRNLLDLIGQAQHHLRQELSVSLKNIGSVTLEARALHQALAPNSPGAAASQTTRCVY